METPDTDGDSSSDWEVLGHWKTYASSSSSFEYISSVASSSDDEARDQPIHSDGDRSPCERVIDRGGDGSLGDRQIGHNSPLDQGIDRDGDQLPGDQVIGGSDGDQSSIDQVVGSDGDLWPSMEMEDPWSEDSDHEGTVEESQVMDEDTVALISSIEEEGDDELAWLVREEALHYLQENKPRGRILLPIPPPLPWNSCGARFYCRLCGVFYRSPDGSTAYTSFPMAPSVPRTVLSLGFLPEQVDVLASSYGLLCCREKRVDGPTKEDLHPRRYYVCNPTTLNWTTLRCPPDHRDHGDDPAVAIVFSEPMTNYSFQADYHLVCAFPINGLEGVYAFDVFSSKNWQWNTSKDVCVTETLLSTSGVGVGGKASWRSTMDMVVMFDPLTDECKTFPWPAGYSDSMPWSLGELDGELCAVCVSPTATEVYTLEDDDEAGDSLGWIKTWELNPSPVVGNFHAEGDEEDIEFRAWPLPGQSTREVLFKLENKLVAMDVMTSECRFIGGPLDPIHGAAFFPYTSSLVRPRPALDVGLCG